MLFQPNPVDFETEGSGAVICADLQPDKGLAGKGGNHVREGDFDGFPFAAGLELGGVNLRHVPSRLKTELITPAVALEAEDNAEEWRGIDGFEIALDGGITGAAGEDGVAGLVDREAATRSAVQHLPAMQTGIRGELDKGKFTDNRRAGMRRGSAARASYCHPHEDPDGLDRFHDYELS